MNDAAPARLPDYAAALLTPRPHPARREEITRPPPPLWRKRRPSIRFPNTRWALADALRSPDRNDEAARVEQQLVAQGSEDPRTLALFLSTRREEGVRALALARQELEKLRQRLHAGRSRMGTGLGWRNRRSILAHDARPGGGHAFFFFFFKKKKKKKSKLKRGAGRARPRPFTSPCFHRSLGTTSPTTRCFHTQQHH